jgi:type III secretion system YscQ/HrcQ family protein
VSRVAPFPWHAFERIPREVASALGPVGRAFDRVVQRTALASAVRAVCGEPVEIAATELTAHGMLEGAAPEPVACLLSSSDLRAHVLLETDPELAARLAGNLLRRPVAWVDRSRAAPAAIQGAFAAFALAVARRAAARGSLGLCAVGKEASERFRELTGAPAVAVRATLLVGGEAFRLTASIRASRFAPAPSGPFDPGALARLGEMPLALQVVGGSCAIALADFESLRAGDALLPGSGWTVGRQGAELAGVVVLCAPATSSGIAANLRGARQVVLGQGAMSAEHDTEVAGAPDAPDPIERVPAAQALAEVPVVVRVELGEVTLTAREWAALRPGDVVTTGRRIGERATLRVAGRAVARGELVDVDGELGVRVHALVGSDERGASPGGRST